MKRAFATCTMTLLVACATYLPCGVSFAGDYPERPVHWIVPYPPGGTTDVIARFVAQAVGTTMHGTIVVDNRAGAGGQIAMNAVTQADPDGYMLLVSDASVATVPSLYKQLTFDPTKLQAVALFATVPHIVVVNPTVQANSLVELIALSKKAPGTLNFGSGGVGSPLHLAGEALRVESGIAWTHIPYKGAAPAILAVVSNEVQIATPSLPAALSLVQSGQLRALAVMSRKRLASLPNVPTVAEAGFPKATAIGWVGLHTPQGTPANVRNAIEAAVNTALQNPELRERLAAQGAEVTLEFGAVYGKRVAEEATRWNEIVKAAGIPPQ